MQIYYCDCLTKFKKNISLSIKVNLYHLIHHMASSFIFYLLGIAYFDVLLYKFGQILKCLSCAKNNTTYILDRREY